MFCFFSFLFFCACFGSVGPGGLKLFRGLLIDLGFPGWEQNPQSTSEERGAGGSCITAGKGEGGLLTASSRVPAHPEGRGRGVQTEEVACWVEGRESQACPLPPALPLFPSCLLAESKGLIKPFYDADPRRSSLCPLRYKSW